MICLILLLCMLVFALTIVLWRKQKLLTIANRSLEALYATGKSGLTYQNGERDIDLLTNQILRIEELLERGKQHAQEESEGKSRFLENIAHQMKNSAAALQVQLDLMEGEGSEPENLCRCQTTLDRLDGELNYILRSCQLAAGKVEMQFSPCDLRELMEHTAELLAPLTRNRNVTLLIQAEKGCVVPCDKFWMGQGLENLMKNALEHSPVGGTVTLRLENSPGCVWLMVEDEGSGISQEDLSRLFTRYYRGDHSRHGYGLGLNMARDIARGHHGNLTAENRPEGGARFVMSFPVIEGAAYYGDY